MSDQMYTVGRPFQIGLALSGGNELFKKYLGAWVGSFVLAILVVGVVGGMLNGANSLLENIVSGTGGIVITTMVANLIINPILWFLQGMVYYLIDRGHLMALDRGRFEFNDLFLGDKPFARYGLASLFENFLRNLPNLFLAIPMALTAAAVVSSSGPGAVGPMLLAILPFGLLLVLAHLALSPFFLFFSYVAIDHPKKGLLECLAFSWRMGLKNYWAFMGLSVVAGLAMLVGVLACGIGIIFSVPWGMCMLAAGYRQLVPGNAESGTARNDAWEAEDRAQEDAYQDDGSWDEGTPADKNHGSSRT